MNKDPNVPVDYIEEDELTEEEFEEVLSECEEFDEYEEFDDSDDVREQ